MFVAAEKESVMFHMIYFVSIFVSCRPRGFKLDQAERVQTMKEVSSFKCSL